MPGPVRRRLAVLPVLVTLAALVATAVAAPAQAGERVAHRVTPGNFTGYGFDACLTPDQATMDTWLATSPYWAVGVYAGGENRACPDQPELTADWVATQTRHHWRILPLYVGRQAPCYGGEKSRMNPDPADHWAAARAQGHDAAVDAVHAVRDLGIAPHSTVWFDMENFDISVDNCRKTALHFLNAWTRVLHRRDFRSGVYSSASAAIMALDQARLSSPGAYTMPDQVWFARWNKHADTDASGYVAEDGWAHDRIHQYEGDVGVAFGGIAMDVDRDYLDVGRGSRPGKQPPHCRGTNLDFPHYRFLERGDRGAMVKAGQCLLKQQGFFHHRPGFRFTRATARAVRHFQRSHGLGRSAHLNRRTWTVLLTGGRTPLVKIGSANDAVRRLQRGLNAATGAAVEVTGDFDRPTTQAVRGYQRTRGLPHTGVVTDDTWQPLQAGRR